LSSIGDPANDKRDWSDLLCNGMISIMWSMVGHARSKYQTNPAGGEQYGDSTQLIYLRARYYNPADGRFTSRDTWSGDVRRSLTLNRWIYVEGNPTNATDPSGYITEKESQVAMLKLEELRRDYNIRIKKDWGYLITAFSIIPEYMDEPLYPFTKCQWANGNWRSLQELQWTLDAVKEMSAELGGSDKFRSAMGSYHIQFYRTSTDTFYTYGGYSINNVILPNWPFNTTDIRAKRTVVHELAHVWDARQWGRLSFNMMHTTKSFREVCNNRNICYKIYDPKNAIESALTVSNSYAETNEREDWAVSFEYFMYPGSGAATTLGPIRKSYIEMVLKNSRNP